MVAYSALVNVFIATKIKGISFERTLELNDGLVKAIESSPQAKSNEQLARIAIEHANTDGYTPDERDYLLMAAGVAVLYSAESPNGEKEMQDVTEMVLKHMLG